MILVTNLNIKKLKIFLLNKKLNNKKIKFCSKCLAMSTRPRITFNKDDLCNACVWVDKKKKLIGIIEKLNWNNYYLILEKKMILIALYL